jgi:hypothetical protein
VISSNYYTTSGSTRRQELHDLNFEHPFLMAASPAAISFSIQIHHWQRFAWEIMDPELKLRRWGFTERVFRPYITYFNPKFSLKKASLFK